MAVQVSVNQQALSIERAAVELFSHIFSYDGQLVHNRGICCLDFGPLFAVSKDVAQRLHVLGRSHGMGANRLWARAHEEGIRMGLGNIDDFAFSGPFSLSVNLLAGLSFELLLKSAYVALGGQSKDSYLRNEIGHDLVIALERAKEQGFYSQAPYLEEVVGRINEPYKKNWFRYNPQDVLLPEFEAINSALVSLEADVGRLCKALD
jgi:hypothetical protein